jgi:hypothetical protein
VYESYSGEYLSSMQDCVIAGEPCRWSGRPLATAMLHGRIEVMVAARVRQFGAEQRCTFPSVPKCVLKVIYTN